jgi:hypothetical protein|tara:strand:+ start:9816 stop:10028 length:213 start_codon:yes stop_codon:yes gene_type:complete
VDKFLIALTGSITFCVAGPLVVLLVIKDLPITWINIFLVGGIESFFILMAIELGKLTKQLWRDMNDTRND